jgi:hypothetical protein
MHLKVHAYVCMYVCVCVCVCELARMWKCMLHVRTYMCARVRVHAYIYTVWNVCNVCFVYWLTPRGCVCVGVCVCVCVCA